MAVLYTVFLVVVYGGEHVNDHPNETKFRFEPCIAQSIPIVCFALMCHLTVVPATGGLQEYWPSINNPGYTRFRKLVSISVSVIVLCFTLYFPTGFFGYHTFGVQTKQDILDNFG